MRRFKAGPRGSGMAYKKRMSHIKIVLAEKAADVPAESATS
jgi:ribosomal protein L22